MVELLVALAVSSVIVMAVFFVMTSSSRSFRVQTDAAQASDRLNYALETVRADLRRASFLTVPNAYLPQSQYPWYRQVCAAPSWLGSATRDVAAHAVTVQEGSGGALTYYQPDAARQIMPGSAPDELILMGAFRVTEPFRPTSMQAGLAYMTIANNGRTEEEMNYIFQDAWISVSAPAGGMQFLAISNVDPGTTTTTIQTSTPLAADPAGTGLEGCNFSGFGGSSFEIVPLHFVRYSIAMDPDDPESSLLVREELGSSGQSLTDLSRHIVARDIVDFQVWFDGVGATGLATDVLVDGEGTTTWVDDSGTVPNADVNGGAVASPENVRMAYVQVSARLDSVVARRNPEPGSVALRQYLQLDDCNSASGACVPVDEWTRTMTMRSEVVMPNVALANTRTNP